MINQDIDKKVDTDYESPNEFQKQVDSENHYEMIDESGIYIYIYKNKIKKDSNRFIRVIDVLKQYPISTFTMLNICICFIIIMLTFYFKFYSMFESILSLSKTNLFDFFSYLL
jgi:hypothetical protein